MQKTSIATLLVQWSLLLTLLTVCGCDRATESQVAVSHLDGIDSLPPQQVRRALEQLSSSDARQQTVGLQFVESFPSLAETHRTLIERLAASGATPMVKRKAGALLGR